MKTGNPAKIKDNLTKLIEYFQSKNFKDSFKGVFSIEKLPKGNIDNAVRLMERLKENL
ncbi:hypothetical protein J4212_03450 [Candidatus Woesearchaeota archaeon]|nr:hypothetical protein [Candidatus Woesearchaeota archaeon]